MFIYYIIGALILTQIPFVGKYFKLFNTLVHEIGHVLTAIITRSRVHHITLSPDTSGQAATSSRKFAGIIISFAGYPFASGVGLALIWFVHQEQYTYILYGVIGVIVISLIFWIRNLFGILWLLVAGVITLGVLLYTDPLVIEVYTKAIVAVIFVESFSSTITLLVIVFKDRKNAGDARSLARETAIPEIVWSLVFIAIACIPIYFAYKLWF